MLLQFRAVQFLLILSLCLFGCGETEKELAPAYPPPAIAEDLVVVSSGKADAFFNPDNLIEDAVFMDAEYMSADEILGFFQTNPYGGRSFLTDYEEDNMSAAEIVADAASEFGINPLVLLTKIQVESSLIYATAAPTLTLLNRATGCGCHDGMSYCSAGAKGFRRQVRCAAEAFQSYLQDLTDGGQTISGWQVGVAKMAQDDVLVRPENAATAALYTYTPWVLPYQGGNWLFRNVFLKFSHFVLTTKPNHHWIGGGCTSDSSCGFDGGICNVPGTDEGFCTKPCDLYCPESSQPNTAGTFCVEANLSEETKDHGWCLAKCDILVFPHNQGCAPEFTCETHPRHNDPNTSADICFPDHR